MLKPLNLFLIQHDEPVLDLEAMTLTEIEKVVECNGAILWDFHGELRILPTNVIADHMRMAHSRSDLERLNRTIGMPERSYKMMVRFTRDQTVSVNSVSVGRTASDTPSGQNQSPIQPAPTSPRTSRSSDLPASSS